MGSGFRWGTRLLIVLTGAFAGWLLVAMTRGSSAHRFLHPNDPGWSLVINPGAPMVAFYLFLVALTLIPPVCCLGLMRSGGSPRLRVLYGTLAVVGLCVASIVAGYGYESSRSQIRLTRDKLWYRAGAQSAEIGWPEVGMMVLRWHHRNQSLELRGQNEVVRIDLSTFAVPDQVLLVRKLQELAHLMPVRHRSANEWVWRRAFQINLPPE